MLFRSGAPRHGTYYLLTAYQIPLCKTLYDYKNKRGHIGVIAGSEGMLGAARLCCEAALRAGAGLVTLHVHKDVYPLIAPSMPPEIMVRPVDSYADISIRTFSAFLIGPGIGSVSEEDAEAIRLILETGTPTVLDADGLNLAAAMQWNLENTFWLLPTMEKFADFCQMQTTMPSAQTLPTAFWQNMKPP